MDYVWSRSRSLHGGTRRSQARESACAPSCAGPSFPSLFPQTPKSKNLASTKAKLLPHERALLARGALHDVTHARASSIWLHARSTSAVDDTSAVTTVYRPMGDGEACHLVAHGMLPATQPYQAIIEGERGRGYAEKYLVGHKKVDTDPTTVVEFVVPRSLIAALFARQHKVEDGAMSMGLGAKAGDGLGEFNAALERGEATWRIVTIKRPNSRMKAAGREN